MRVSTFVCMHLRETMNEAWTYENDKQPASWNKWAFANTTDYSQTSDSISKNIRDKAKSL